MLNHFNFEKFKGKILITNDLGRFHFLNEKEFSDLLTNKIDSKSELYTKLKKDYFILESKTDLINDELIYAIRDMKNYVMMGPSLHIFAVTNICNINCIYCQARDHQSESAGYMTLDTGCKAIDLALQSPASSLTFEFQGGEPLLNFDVIKGMILYAEDHKGTKTIDYTMVSNLLALTEDKIAFLKNYNVSVSTSMDGPKTVHDNNRRAGVNKSSFDFMERGLKRLQDEGISGGAIETTTRYSLSY
ncbi:arylsulfatase regulator (Fe-S oxidoreductase), partial [Lachnospiraceae bacterium JC7]